KEATETIIGEPGWYFTTDTRSRTGSIIPAKLSTFDASYPTPLPEAVEPFDPANTDHFQIPIGIALPEPGEKHRVQHIDLASHQHTQTSWIGQDGTSTFIIAYVALALARGLQLAISDTTDKAVYFLWCKECVLPGG